MEATPFRCAVGDVRRCLELLREADRLLDAVPRTADRERADAAQDRTATRLMVAGAVGAAVLARASDPSTATPNAVQQLGEAIGLINQAADALDQHPTVRRLRQPVRLDGPPEPTARHVATIVREVYPQLREEFGLTAVPMLTNWDSTDAEDEAALSAVGLDRRSKAIKVAIVVLPLVLFYGWLLSQ